MELKLSGINLLFGDVYEKIKLIPDHSVSLIYWDGPTRGTSKGTRNKFVPVPDLIDEINRTAKPNCRLIVQTRKPDSTHFMNELADYYDTVWYVERPHYTPPSHNRKQPAGAIDEILVFTLNPDSKLEPSYHEAQAYETIHEFDDFRKKVPSNFVPANKKDAYKSTFLKSDSKLEPSYHEAQAYETIHEFDDFRKKVPSNFVPANKKDAYKSTFLKSQRPVGLLEYFLQVYSSPDDVVLDLFMGSGSMGIACMNAKRVYFGCEVEENIFSATATRISEYTQGREFKFVKSKRKGRKIQRSE